MENLENTTMINHVIDLGSNKSIRIWETLPKINTKKRKNTIIIVSSFTKKMDHFSGLAEYLSNNGFHIIRYDSLHHVGLSSGNINEFTMTAGKNNLLTIINWLKTRGINQLGLFAASLSARIAYEIAASIKLSFLVTAVGVINLRDTLKRALKCDYLQLAIEDLPKSFNFEGHNFEAKSFVADCLNNKWDTLESTKNKLNNLDIPFIIFTANNDNWVKESEVIELIDNIHSDRCKIYSLIGGSHNLGANLVVLRNFYQSITKAAIVADHGSVDIDINIDINEPQFETLTTVTVNERRLKNKIESEMLSIV
ncbi:fatty acid reductase transferase subunit LuxD [Candidatus Enterovibrio altilux]|uniref:fatty acid reductase transferase subunit LuxD n=1 Tax=Candidatus Enterovibrio altilux TaxID=1927128 RepID=UPI0012380561|nr:acyl transferase [Candidatus Enterovibrio luxaltus]